MDITLTQLLRPCARRLSSCRLIAQSIKFTFFAGTLLITSSLALATDLSCQRYIDDLVPAIKAAQLSCPKTQTLEEVNDCLQKNWLRKGERYNQPQDLPVNQNLADVFNTYDGVRAPLLPHSQHFKVVVLLGSSYPVMLEHLGFFVKLAQKFNLTFDHLVALGSDRPLNAPTETLDHIRGMATDTTKPRVDIDAPTDETGGWKYIKACSTLPDHWPDLEVLNTNAKAGQARATTSDTLETLKEVHPDWVNGSAPVLLISTQPFAQGQEGNALQVFGPHVPIETAASDELVAQYPLTNSYVILNMQDMLARLTYQALHNIKSGLTKKCPVLIREVPFNRSQNEL